MQYRNLGTTGLKVSVVGLGCNNFGMRCDADQTREVVHASLDAGINFFDTADVYGWEVEHGHTEEIIGRWLAQGGGRRDATVLATKVFNPVTRKANLPEINSDERSLSAYKIRKHVHGSLKRLQTEWIDIYQMHHIDRDCPWDETWSAFNSLINQGKVVYVGSSNFAGWDIATACQEASKRNMMGLVSEQSIYHLNNRTIELEVIPACEHYGLGLIPWSPLDGGMLGGALEKMDTGRRKGEAYEERVEENRDKLKKYESLCREIGHPPGEVALAWLLHNPVVTAPIIGPRTIEQLESAVRAAEITLEEDVLQKLDGIFPGPGGAAPQAYAW